MQPRLNIAKSACEIIEEEVRRLFINKSSDALRNTPVREIITSKVVEHINTYYKLGEKDFIHFANSDDKNRLNIDDPKIIYNQETSDEKSFIWVFNFINDYENFCRKLPFWSLSISIMQDKQTVFSIITNPIIDLLIFSEKGSGSVNNQRKVRAHTSSQSILVCKSDNVTLPKALSNYKVLSLNSMSIELIYLSLGLIDYFVIDTNQYKNYQDCILIAKEAGIMSKEYDNCMILANETNLNQL
tara:strand:+ start:33172 stop:33900 length:729 start_codon:yes stop_codon:yes gene_type:complete